jgi:hypothetical protein
MAMQKIQKHPADEFMRRSCGYFRVETKSSYIDYYDNRGTHVSRFGEKHLPTDEVSFLVSDINERINIGFMRLRLRERGVF